MSPSKASPVKSGTLLLMLAVCALSVFCCLLLYNFDNKYTVKGPQAKEGLLVLGDAALAAQPVLFLVEGWEYYGGELLTPADFAQAQPMPDSYIYIGQYGGFEMHSATGSPHGSASYRLQIELPAEPREYLLELPEIFSAYHLYINGERITGMGDPSPQSYRPEAGNRAVYIDAGGRVEILLAVSDFSHFYSGLVYPPAFGEPQAVARLLDARLVFRSVLAAFALAVGLISVLIGLLSRKNALAALYGLLCLFFVGYTAYPILRAFISGAQALYAIEMASFCAMLAVVILLQRQLHGGQQRWSKYFVVFSLCMCAFSAALPLLLVGGLAMMAVYSYLLSAYLLVTAAYITITAVRALLRGQAYSAVMLCGFLIFDVALIMDRLLPLHEPIVTGWFAELAGFALILCLGMAVGQEVAATYRDNAVLLERQAGLERLHRMQQASYEVLMGTVEEAKTARHDLRHHLVMIDGFLQSRAYDKLGEYIAAYQASLRQGEPLAYTRHIVADVLLRHYAGISRERGIAYEVRAEIGPEIEVSDVDLCILLSNLLENAVEACERMPEGGRFLTISITQSSAALSVHMQNSAAAASRQAGGFLSAKAAGRTGYGLQSVAAIAKRYGGEAIFEYDAGAAHAGAFISTVLLPCRKPEQ